MNNLTNTKCIELLEEVKEYIDMKIYELDITYPKFERYERKAYKNIINFINLKIEQLQKDKL